MPTQLHLGDITVEVILKDIKNVHLSVYPPAGRVRIAAPKRMDIDTIRVFAISKLDWIKAQQQKLRAQARDPPRDYIERESHYLWGERYLLRVIEANAAPRVERTPRQIILTVRPGSSVASRAAVMDAWYRQNLREAVTPLLEKWQALMQVSVADIRIQRMKTRWGSCTPATRRIRLNTELAKKPPTCLEYVLVHELAHLLEASHNARFRSLMDHFMPNWQHHRDLLNDLPLREEGW